jgi:MarR family transcriptional regulator for hemolysin
MQGIGGCASGVGFIMDKQLRETAAVMPRRKRGSQAARPLPLSALPDEADRSRCFFEVLPSGATEGSLEDTKLRLTRRILFLSRQWRHLLNEALRATGESHARWVTLLWIDMLAGLANVGEIAERVGVESPTLVRLLNRLEKEGLVSRRALNGSNRAKTAVLTAKGKRKILAMSVVVDRTQAEFLSEIDAQRLTQALGVPDEVLAKYVRVVMWPG